MISISSLVFDALGTIDIDENVAGTNFGVSTRRQNRIPTLNATSVLQDRGYTDSDRTFTIQVKVFTDEIFDRLQTLVSTQAEARISCRAGVFIGTIRNLSFENRRFNFLVTAND